MAHRLRKRWDLTEKRLRSAITNGRVTVPGLDGRSAWMRRLMDLRNLHTNDLGGDDIVSHSEQVLIARTAMLTLQCELMEASFAHTDGIASTEKLETLQRVTNTLRRNFECLGIRRRPKEIETLEQYLSRNDAAKEEKELECELSENHHAEEEGQS